MSLDGALSIATSGLAAVQGQIGVVSQNVANASTAGYTEEVAPAIETSAAGQPDGVRLGVATRVTAPFLQSTLYSQNATVSAQTTISNALNAITSVEGSTDSNSGSNGSLTALLSNLQSGLTSLQAVPTSSSQQQTVIQSANQLAIGINSLAATYAQQRQAASDAIGSEVQQANSALQTIGALSSQIVGLQAMGQSTAGLEDQRQNAMTTLSGLISVRFTEQPSGDLSVTTASGLTLPTDGSQTLAYQDQTLSQSGTVPPITLTPATGGASADVTGMLSLGSIGANVALRDTTIPSYMTQLDDLATQLSARFNSQGMPLFQDATGPVPASSIGFASDIEVNPGALPSPATFFTIANIGAVDQNVFGSYTDPTSGAATTLSGQVTDLLSGQGADAQAATSALSDATGLQSSLNARVTSSTGVSIDSEMSKMVSLQNSYQANAKIITAVQSMYTALLDAINP